MQGRLEGKVCVITGIAGGMGRVAADLFTAQGAKVVGCDLFNDRAVEVERELTPKGRQIKCYDRQCDLSDPAEARAFADFAGAAFDGVDVLYNNAAMYYGEPIETMSVEIWRKCMAEELDIVFYVTQAFWPYLVKRGGGSIINTASLAGYIGSSMAPMIAHSSAKAGVQGFTRALAIEGGPHKIRVNSVSPGPVWTPQLAAMGEENLQKFMMPRMVIGRLGQPEDIVNYALFLASDESTWITGTDLNIDGGSRIFA